MKVLCLILLLPLIACEDSARPTLTDKGSTVSAPKTTPKAKPKKTPKLSEPVVERYFVPAEFARYVDKFYVLMLRAGLNHYRRNVQFIMEPTLSSQIAGNCTYATYSNHAIIRINPIYWWNAPYQRREYLMFHELGHCVLNRGHNSSLHENDRALSVMHPFGLPYDDEYLEHYKHYMTELFRAPPDKFASTQFLASYYWEHPYHTMVAANSERNEFIGFRTSQSELPPSIECGSH